MLAAPRRVSIVIAASRRASPVLAAQRRAVHVITAVTRAFTSIGIVRDGSPLCVRPSASALRRPNRPRDRRERSTPPCSCTPASCPPWRAVIRRDQPRGKREHHSPPVSRRRTPCCAGASGIDREADERILLPESCRKYLTRGNRKVCERWLSQMKGRIRCTHLTNLSEDETPPSPSMAPWVSWDPGGRGRARF